MCQVDEFFSSGLKRCRRPNGNLQYRLIVNISTSLVHYRYPWIEVKILCIAMAFFHSLLSVNTSYQHHLSHPTFRQLYLHPKVLPNHWGAEYRSSLRIFRCGLAADSSFPRVSRVCKGLLFIRTPCLCPYTIPRGRHWWFSGAGNRSICRRRPPWALYATIGNRLLPFGPSQL